ncbi:metallophosphoesterase [Candidatus Daviesbacteria bacterium]|nr:metallophosphoesterase [Candidatus Daviesbacteria bacterium]
MIRQLADHILSERSESKDKMFGRHNKGRRHTNILFVIFRLTLSLVIFVVLLAGIYSAYKHFSGLDPVKMNPQSLISQLVSSNNFEKFLPAFLTTLIAKDSQKDILGQLQTQPHVVPQSQPTPNTPKTPKYLFSFMLIADSHSDNANLAKALKQAKEEKNLKFVIGLGDYTEVGTLDELKQAKLELDKTGLIYFLVPGDHDLWDSRNRSLSPNENFRQIFGPSYQSFTESTFRLILIYNSDNYRGLDDSQLSWLESELNSASANSEHILVFLHEPLLHPSSDHVMGRVEVSLKDQAKNLISKLSQYRVKKIFAGDTHYFSEYQEPETKLEMVTIGAITSLRNPQLPRFAIVSAYEDGSTTIEDVEIN